MGEVSSDSILIRKVAKGRENHQAKAMTVQKALRLSVAKVAEDLHDLALAAIGVKASMLEQPELEGQFVEDSLLLLLDGPRRQTGLAIVDKSLAGALVQQQTTATVRPETDDSRLLTSTDAAMVAPLLDGLLGRVAKTVESDEDARIFNGFGFGAMAQDSRLALMALEANEYNHFTLTLDIARGTRQSTLHLFFPIADDSVPVDDDDDFRDEDDDDANTEPKVSMADTVLQLEADLNIVLCKMRLPLGVLETLQPGQSIQLPPNAFPSVSVTGVDGRIIGKGEVGQIDGQRAVKVPRPPSYAAMPMRRASDAEGLDLPEVEGLDRRSNGAGASSGGLPDFPTGDLPALLPGDLPDLPANDLPDLPDISIPDPSDSGEQDALPELPPIDGLPDLDDLPDLSELGDLPDLKTA